MDIARYISGVRLNARLAGLVLTNRLLRKDDLARGYDTAANTYDSEWLCILKPVTDQLLKILPQFPPGEIYDLGCGTGYTTLTLAKRFPGYRISGIDISFGMLTRAAHNCPTAFFIHADSLHFLSGQAAESAGGIIAAWSLGGSPDLPLEIAECRRVLKKKGSFAFIISLADSMAPVLYAFQKCMYRYPGKVTRALLPQYPKNWNALEKLLNKNSFKTVWMEEDRIDIKPDNPMRPLAWLLKTGVLAGFETVLPLRSDKAVAEYFEQELLASEIQLQHHFIAAIAQPIPDIYTL
jgi:ubiquinone/menaquinone biosynthesis C-methylase UbiE